MDNIATATGNDLDRIAELWGISRDPGEVDESIRQRIRSLAFGGGGGIWDPITLTNDIDFSGVEIDKNYGKLPLGDGNKPKCECGASSLGYTQPGQGHSHYCPLSK